LRFLKFICTAKLAHGEPTGRKVKQHYFLTCYHKLYDARNECRCTDVERSEKISRSPDLRDTRLTFFGIFGL